MSVDWFAFLDCGPEGVKEWLGLTGYLVEARGPFRSEFTAEPDLGDLEVGGLGSGPGAAALGFCCCAQGWRCCPLTGLVQGVVVPGDCFATAEHSGFVGEVAGVDEVGEIEDSGVGPVSVGLDRGAGRGRGR